MNSRQMTEETVDEVFYAPLISTIENEEEKMKQNLPHFALQSLSSVAAALSRLRSSFYRNPSNQKTVAENKRFRNTLVSFMKFLLREYFPALNDLKGKETKENVEQIESSLYDTVSLCITTFVNMMAGNSVVRKAMWPFIQVFIWDIISIASTKVSHMGAALFHQFLLEEELKEKILNSDVAILLIPPLLKSYIIEGPHSCFSLFCLETLVEAPEAVPSNWDKLSLKESLLLLDILTNLLLKETASIPSSTIQFMQEVYKKDADRVFALHDDQMISNTSITITRITNFLSCAASSDLFRTYLQRDKSLLISSVYLLRGITEMGDFSKNVFSRIQDTDRVDGEFESHVAVGFKTDLIRLLANLVFRHKDNQDTFREIEGLFLVLENSQFDARNPLIREASIFALRNLLEGNSENQKLISRLHIKGVAENKGLDQLGFVVTINNGKVSLHQK